MSLTGRVTRRLRDEFLKHRLERGHITQAASAAASTLSFTASPNKPLYFWQLYSVMGSERIHRVIHCFYTNVFADDSAPWFRDVFVEFGTVKYHVAGQYRFWMDVFAGGVRYKAGMPGLRFHHKLAQQIMTQQGAQRWMFHMQRAIEQCRPDWDERDVRILPCIETFLTFTMECYGVQFDFNVVDWIHHFSTRGGSM